MSTQKKINLAAASFMIVLLAAVMIFFGCKKNNNDDDNGSNTIPNETSTYWEDDYRQHQLNGKVKTVKTITRGMYGDIENSYVQLEFDSKGNIAKKLTLFNDDPTYYHGYTYTYDAQNRLTKLVFGFYDEPEEEVAEFGYDGSHTMYFPTNIFDMGALGLQKGITSINYKNINEEKPVIVRCTSMSGKSVFFEGQSGFLADLLGLNCKVEVESQGSYPAKIKFLTYGALKIQDAATTFGADGMPTKIVLTEENGATTTTEFTTKAGFLLITKYIESKRPDRYKEWRYNDKGEAIYHRTQSGVELRYNYTAYDTHGNWTEKTEEYFENSDGVNRTYTREFIYW